MKQLLVVLLLAGSVASAQTLTGETHDKQAEVRQDTTLKMGWNMASVAGLNLTQASFTRWAPGGENSLAFTAALISGATHVSETLRWANYLNLRFGQSRLGDQGLRKTDDEIYLESLLLFLVWQKVSPYASVTLRTQFAPGYNYPDAAPKEEISKFFDPAYLTQSVGLAWEPTPIFSTRLGVGAREVITSQFTAFADDPETAEIEKTRIWGGLENISMLKWEFAENMAFISRLELFAPFNAMDRVVLRSDNFLTAKVNEYVNVGLNAQFVNDVNISPYTQIKQTLSIGVSYTLL
jgi:hypothetical protein